MGDRKKAVLFFFHCSDINNGGVRSMIDVIDYLAEADQFKMYAVFSDYSGSAIEYLKKRGISILPIRHATWHYQKTDDKKRDITVAAKTLLKQFRNIKFFFEISQYLDKYNIDCLYSNTFGCFAGALCSRRFGIPHIWHIREFGEQDHNMRPIFGWNYFYKLANQSTDKVIVISNSLKERYEGKIGSSRMSVIYDDISPEYINDNIPSSNEVTNILIAGTVQNGKRQMDAVRAVELATGEGADVHLYIAGSEVQPYAGKVRKYIEENNLENSITLLGYVKDMNTLRSKMDIGLVCSQSEAFGRVTVEGMLSHMIMIGADGAGTKELITNGKTGYLYKLGNVDELSGLICKISADLEIYSTIGEQGFEFAKKRFTTGQCGRQVLEFIQRV